MSAPVDTNNEGDGESELDQWLQQNRLTSIRDRFQQNDVILQDLIDLSSSSMDELKSYAREELGLNLMNSMKFAKAVAALKSQQQETSKPAVVEKVIRIVMSAEEEIAINKIHKKQETVKQKINTTSKNINILNKLAKMNEDEVNNFRKQVMTRFNQRMDAIITKSNVEIKKKETMISGYIDKLKAYNKLLSDANSQSDDLLNDNKMDKSKRKTKIMSIAEDVLKQQVKEMTVTPMVKVEINRDGVMEYLDGIGSINSYNVPEKPIISVNDIKETSATVRFNNIKQGYDCMVELFDNEDHGGNDDEKKMDNEWKEMCLVKNESEYKLKDLKDDQAHSVRAKYKSKHGFGELSDAVTFKTKKMQINIPSSILTEMEKKSFLSLLAQNGKALKTKSWNLIYRGTRDGLNRNGFINKVHGKPNVICFIHTEGDNVCGGYTSTGWENGKQHNTYSKDAKAFVFGIRSSQNYASMIVNVKANDENGQALYYHNNTYCTFGSVPDIYVHTNGYCYDRSTNGQYDSFPNTCQLLGGKDEEKLKEIEVFELK